MNEEAKLAVVFHMLAESDLPIEELDIEVASRNSLRRSGIHTVAQLLQLTHTKLVGLFPNRSLSFYSEIIYKLTCLAEPPKTAKTEDTCTAENLQDDFWRTQEETFNIFQVAGIWKSEEIHTRVIAELLNPKSRFHTMGTTFLEKFLDKLDLNTQYVKEDLSSPKSIQVQTEVHTTAENETETKLRNRRIDMVIETKHYYLPFEVKIWARDQKSQLYDYYHYACSKAQKLGKKVLYIYYLTPDGHAPSDWSLGGTDDELPVFTLSFQKDILPWLNDCITITDQTIPTDVLEIMKQLHDNIAANFLLEDDILDFVQQELSRCNLEQTECVEGDYLTFTLHSEGKNEGDWEVALRIKKYHSNKVKLSVICGQWVKTDNALQINYAGNRKREEVEPLLKETFAEPWDLLNLDVDRAWDWCGKFPSPVSREDFLTAFSQLKDAIKKERKRA